MKYPVIKKFRDKYTKILYKASDIYETEDVKRAEYLQGKGVLGELIEEPKPRAEITQPEITSAPEPRHTGGGWYELPDGTRVKGREAAENALKNAEKRW